MPVRYTIYRGASMPVVTPAEPPRRGPVDPPELCLCLTIQLIASCIFNLIGRLFAAIGIDTGNLARWDVGRSRWTIFMVCILV
jgi:hypothetical protein